MSLCFLGAAASLRDKYNMNADEVDAPVIPQSESQGILPGAFGIGHPG